MNIKIIYALTLMGVLALTSQVAVAHGVKCGDLIIAHPYSPPTIGSGNTGAVYFMNIKNTGKEVDQLIGARTGVSSIVEIHEMTLENNVMKMRAIPEVQFHRDLKCRSNTAKLMAIT